MNRSILRPNRQRAFKWFAAIALACLSASHAYAFSVFTVGGDASCGYTSIQDAVNASNNTPGQNYIFIAQNFTYSQQHVVITNGDMIIEGGFPDCNTFTNGTNTTLIVGTSGHSIFEIEGTSTVALWNLEMTGASLNSSQKGGAIYFGGQGDLSLMNDWIHDNTAGYGGAFAVNAAGATTVEMMSNLLIGSNTALVQGGAIRVEGQTKVTSGWQAGQAPIYIGGNTAEGQGDVASGGGIEVVGPASFYGAARIHDNNAAYGGGIAMYAHNGDDAVVYLYTTDPGNAVLLDSNHATQTGGGVYLKSSNSGAVASLCMQNMEVSNNTAQNGAAVYADVNSGIGSVVGVNDASSCIAPIGNVACAANISCNDISGNVSQTNGGSATTGAAILVQSGGSFSGQEFTAYGNQGGSLVEFVADTGLSQFAQDFVDLHNCVLADNVESGDLIYAHGGHTQTMLEVRNCTIADNQISGSRVIDADVSNSTIEDTIIAQPGVLSLTYTHITTNDYILTNDTTTFAAGSGIEAGTPTFENASNRDYHLVRTSLGVDFAPAQNENDLDGNPRAVDLTDIPNNFGPMDLGAYEIQTQLAPATCIVSDTIFCNGFEIAN